jgi:hypothetical protein
VDRNGCASCSVTGFDISGSERWVSATTELVIFLLC